MFLLAGLWLIINYADNRGYDYPLTRKKYAILLFLAPLVLAEALLQTNYFLRLKPDIITSCCGSLFSKGADELSSGIGLLPTRPVEVIFSLSMAATLVAGIAFYRKGWGGYLFSFLSGATFLVSMASILSFISVYLYELPTHHCPFCLLQREYGYIGYPLYLSMFGGAVSGMGVGVLKPFRGIPSLSNAIPSIQKRLALLSLILLLLFAAIVTYKIIFSNFRME